MKRKLIRSRLYITLTLLVGSMIFALWQPESFSPSGAGLRKNIWEHRYLVLNGCAGLVLAFGLLWSVRCSETDEQEEARVGLIIFFAAMLFVFGNFTLWTAEPIRTTFQTYTGNDPDRPANPGSWHALTETITGRRVSEP